MILLAFAHRGEAQSFISHFELKTSDNRLFVGKELSLLLTGEGICESLTYINFAIAKLNPNKIINYGIAGSLSNKALKDSIYRIRTHYYHNETIEFKSYSDNEGELDLISTNKRVLSDAYAKELSHFAHIVDREAWAIAKSAYSHKITFETYKLISDIAGDQTACFDIKNMALTFSEKMLSHYIEKQNTDKLVSKSSPDLEIENLSFTQTALLKKLIALKARKENKEFEDIMNTVPALFKNKTNSEATNLLAALHQELLPFQATAQKEFARITQGLISIGVNCTTDPHFEKKSINLSFKINSQANIDNLKNSLENLRFDDFEKIWDGKINV